MPEPLLELYAQRLYGPHQRFTPQAGWRPLCNDEWSVLAGYLYRLDLPGRPVNDPRNRLNAIFWLTSQPKGTRWADLPEWAGKPDTVHRQFRRWAHAGLFTRLLKDLAEWRDVMGGAVLRRIAAWIVRAYRRAWRILGLAGIALAKRLGFLSALRGPPWCLPDPSLSVRVTELLRRRFAAREPATPITTQPWFRSATWLIRAARGRRIPRAAPWP